MHYVNYETCSFDQNLSETTSIVEPAWASFGDDKSNFNNIYRNNFLLEGDDAFSSELFLYTHYCPIGTAKEKCLILKFHSAAA
ncbi:MAG: hypothetical protein IJZ87_01450 [Bacteroidales bacterium]|nr:hypothetical protein [Bacteroidales bacterium]